MRLLPAGESFITLQPNTSSFSQIGGFNVRLSPKRSRTVWVSVKFLLNRIGRSLWRYSIVLKIPHFAAFLETYEGGSLGSGSA
jgi:hypothetical protein